MSYTTKLMAITTLALASTWATPSSAQADTALATSEVLELVGVDSASQFAQYSDAFALGEDILPGSVDLLDGALFTDADETYAVLEVDYGSAVSTWIILSEDTCTGTLNSGCLNGYAIDTLLMIDSVQQNDSRARLQAQVYVRADGMQKAATIEFEVGMVDDTLWLQSNISDPDGVIMCSDVFSVSTEDTDADDAPSTQGKNGEMVGAVIGGLIGGLGAGATTKSPHAARAGVLAGAAGGANLFGKMEDWLTNEEEEGVNDETESTTDDPEDTTDLPDDTCPVAVDGADTAI
jgi:hypothetical protein